MSNSQEYLYFGHKDVFFQPAFQCFDSDYALRNGFYSKNQYDSTGIYLPNVAVNLVYSEGESIKHTDFVRSLLVEQGIEQFNGIIYAAHVLFHEEGHLLDFLTSRMSPIDFITRDLSDKYEIQTQREVVISEEYSEEAMNDFFAIYHSTRAESVANSYATKRVVKELETLMDLTVKCTG